MAELVTNSPPATSFSVGDVIYSISKHKRKIIAAAIAGIIAAAAVYLLYAPVYESNAKLLVRYVIDRNTVDPEAGAQKSVAPVLKPEVEILKSWDLAVEVADVVGPKRLLPGVNSPSKTQAAGMIAGGLKVAASGNIIFVSYSNPNPDVANLVLQELLTRYFNKHLEVHRSAGAFDFVSQQTDQLRARLAETEDALRALKLKAGIISLADANAALSQNMNQLQEQIYTAEQEVAEQRARVQRMEQASAEEGGDAPAKRETTDRAIVQTYRAIVRRIEGLRPRELELLARYTPENELVKANEEQIRRLEQQRDELEKQHPELAAAREGAPPSLASERARLSEMQGKLESLKGRLAAVQARVKELSDLGPQITELERNQELQLNSYKYYKSTLEKARVDEALDPSKIPNISILQKPTPPRRNYGKRDRIELALAGGALGGMIVLVLLRELILHPTFKRSFELEKRLGAPLLLSIPYTAKRTKRLVWRRFGRNGHNENGANGRVPPWERDHFIRPYAIAIRDRLGLYFELNRMTHKPKLVGVTGLSNGSGTSTLAAGLAASLSELGDGKVLLVDLNLQTQGAHPFFNGRLAVPLNTALQDSGHGAEPAAHNLYLATASEDNERAEQLGLKKFVDIMPNLKASDFDYIIFDMPPIGPTSPTIGMAGFMDKVLLVVEADKNSRHAVERAYEALTSHRDNVSTVFNKARSYTPAWLNGDS